MPWHIPQAPGEGYKAVLFDLDGVLTPTLEVHLAAWKRAFDDYFSAHGVTPEFSEADYFAHVDGVPRYDGVDRCLKARGIELAWGDPSDAPGSDTVCGIGNAKRAAFAKVLEEAGVTPYAGSVALLDELAHDDTVKVAVVSSSQHAEAVLKSAGLLDKLDALVTGVTAAENGLPGKPAPDTFLLAAQMLGAAPAQCVIVDDALTGVAAGHAGGFGLVVGVDRGHGADALEIAGAHVVIKDLSEMVEA